MCCERRLGKSDYGRPRKRNAFAEAQILVHRTCVLYGHVRTPGQTSKKIALGQQLPIGSAADHQFAFDAEALPEFGVLQCLGSRTVDNLIQQWMKRHVLSLNRYLNNKHSNRKRN